MNIYEKLQNARNLIKENKVKKEGLNKFSGYEYFTPSQISLIVHDACKKSGIIHLYRLVKISDGYVAYLNIIDIEKPEDVLSFEIPTSIPEIKATNEAQRLGGAVTYSERYLLMIAFDIVDNSMDFDTTENTEKSAKKEQKTEYKPLPKISDNFWNVWNKEILEGNLVEIKGIKYQLSKDQVNQCTVYLHQLEELYKQAEEIRYISNTDIL